MYGNSEIHKFFEHLACLTMIFLITILITELYTLFTFVLFITSKSANWLLLFAGLFIII